MRCHRHRQRDKRLRQSDKFKETARKLECDESEERFDSALRTIARQKPRPHEPKKRKKA
jgi:hypothetical protein